MEGSNTGVPCETRNQRWLIPTPVRNFLYVTDQLGCFTTLITFSIVTVRTLSDVYMSVGVLGKRPLLSLQCDDVSNRSRVSGFHRDIVQQRNVNLFWTVCASEMKQRNFPRGFILSVFTVSTIEFSLLTLTDWLWLPAQRQQLSVSKLARSTERRWIWRWQTSDLGTNVEIWLQPERFTTSILLAYFT